ncbi:hypothetical protein AgCh_038902 [Apium graveolens]
MTSTNNLIEVINSIALVDEEDGEIVLGENDVNSKEEGLYNGDVKLCLMVFRSYLNRTNQYLTEISTYTEVRT